MNDEPEWPDGPPDDRSGGSYAEMSGLAGDVVQARNVSGGVNFFRVAESSEPSIPHQLPADVRGFVDRANDLERLDIILTSGQDDSRGSAPCLIVGTAGVGKTSFAVHWAHRMVDQFPDGQLYVNLHGYDAGPPVTPDQALERFLRALDTPSAAIPADVEARSAMYRSRLAGRRVLVVLDNASSAGQVRPLLPGTAGCLVLVTSRNQLPGLVAREGAHRLTLTTLAESESIALLRDVTGDYRPADDLDELAELARLCARLPLALRLAAERAAGRPQMPLRELISDLRDESVLWDALAAGSDDESDAVRTVFAWSYRALTPESSRLFRLLGLHPGPDFSAAAAAVLAGQPLAKVRRLLDELVGGHLLEQPASDRYQFHDLLRAYAIDQVRLEEDVRTGAAVLRRTLLWYLHTADAARAVIVPDSRPAPLAASIAESERVGFASYDDAITWYEQERANLIAAARAADQAAMYDLAWQLPATLHRIYANRNHSDDWRITGDIALRAARHLAERAGEADILEGFGKIYTQSHDLRRGIEFHEAALAIRQEIGDLAGQASSHNGIGLALLRARRLPEAMTRFERTRSLATEIGSTAWEAVATNNLANVYLADGRLETAEQLLSHGLALYRERGDRGAEGDALRCASQIQRGLGRLDEALESITDALAIARDCGNQTWEAWWLVELARVRTELGQPADALESCHRAAIMQRRLGDRSREADAWEAAGEAYRALGRPREAADFFRQAVASYRDVGARWQLAVALDKLAAATSELGTTAEVVAQWTEAVRILAEFADPVAVQLRDQVGRSLAAARTTPDG